MAKRARSARSRRPTTKSRKAHGGARNGAGRTARLTNLNNGGLVLIMRIVGASSFSDLRGYDSDPMQ